jgi:hypothetical protein
MTSGPDPVRVQRGRVASAVRIARAAGFGLWAVSIALVVTALAIGLPAGMLAAATVCLVVGGCLLAPATVLGYAVRAAERDDAAAGR